MTIRTSDDPSLKNFKYGERLYENLVLLSPSVEEFGGDLSVSEITEFVDRGGNLLVACSTYTTDTIRDLASEMGVEVDEEAASLIDHINYDKNDEGMHTLVVSPAENLINAKVIVGESGVGSPLLYRGTGLLVDRNNQLIIPVLTASATAYSHRTDLAINQPPHAMGRSTVLIAALQARNNARVIISGSLEFFSDRFFKASVQTPTGESHPLSGNRLLAESLTDWVFGESGVLRSGNVHHHLQGSSVTPSLYTIKQHVEFNIELEEKVRGEWLPYKANDVQLQVVRIDPFVRVYLRPSSGVWHRASFQLPDVYGVYKFEVHHHRLGYTRIHSVNQVSIRPLEHTEYERFILSAYPYYASAFSMMASCFLFAFVFLHYKENVKTSE